MLRTDRAIVKAGDPIKLTVLSTRSAGSVYVDIVRSGQTILTRDLELQNGAASLTLTATPEMTGVLDLDAYLFGRDAQPIADHRLLFVQPADDLKIEASTDRAVYAPGSDARIRFHVTNAHGEGVSAALGLQIVDEAVFVLAEKQPGFAKVFFYLEQEVMKPRYEIHSLSMPSVVDPCAPCDPAQEARREHAASALFAATEVAHPTRLDTEFGRTLPQDHFAAFHQRYLEVFAGQARSLAEKLSAPSASQPPKPSAQEEIERSFAALAPRDAWNTPLRLESTAWNQGRNRYYRIRSAGPDRHFDDADDLSLFLEARSGTVAAQPGQRGSLELNIEHDRGPDNPLAEVTGTILDSTGAVIPNATVTLKQISSAAIRHAHSNAAGQFSFAALSASRYTVAIASPGFEAVSREFALQARDRAILTSTLSVGSATQTVTVAELPVTPRAFAMLAAQARGGPVALAMNGAAMDQVTVTAAAPMHARSFMLTRKSEPASATAPAGAAAPHIRSYFPEALYINPEILTDAHGNASIALPIADSITTWRMAMLASTQSGALGSGSGTLKVFQDFFVDLDLPVTLTQGDRVSIPIAIYNYSDKAGRVSLKLQPPASGETPWYSLDNDSPDKSLNVDPGRVGASQFTLAANRIGKFKLTLTAHMDGVGANRDDIVVREIEVIPNGREQTVVANGRLEHTVTHDLALPAGAIPGASSVLVRLYPGPLSQVIEGMDAILRMPGGCFEQTSSSTFPNVLALDYMKRTKKLNPEIHAKAEGFIANGYQRLLTFEVPGGGFSWFGQAPANQILTAYGLMEFNDMAKVSDVDPRLIARTRDWLAARQQPDGSWKPDASFINEGATNRYNSNVLRITAYLAWSLANTGYQGPALERAKQYLAQSNTKPAPYTLALIANFAADLKSDPDFTHRAMQALLDARTEKDDQASWTVEETGVYSTGLSAAIETTGLATQALLKWGQASETAHKALNFLSSKKQASGNWGTTQATIMALRALLLASGQNASDVHGTLHIALNGTPVQTLQLTPANNDLLYQFVFKT